MAEEDLSSVSIIKTPASTVKDTEPELSSLVSTAADMPRAHSSIVPTREQCSSSLSPSTRRLDEAATSSTHLVRVRIGVRVRLRVRGRGRGRLRFRVRVRVRVRLRLGLRPRPRPRPTRREDGPCARRR